MNMNTFDYHFATRHPRPWTPQNDWKHWFKCGWSRPVFDNTQCGRQDAALVEDNGEPLSLDQFYDR
jgi:hypothetical protein